MDIAAFQAVIRKEAERQGMEVASVIVKPPTIELRSPELPVPPIIPEMIEPLIIHMEVAISLEDRPRG